MIHCGTKRLETERLVLRRFTLEDAEAMYRNWASDSEVTRFLTWPTHPNVGVTRHVLENWISSYGEDAYYQWAIVLKVEGDEPIGSIAAVKMDESISMVHIGYCIGRKWWHRGITSEALKAVMEFFFDQVGVNRIEARYDINNPHSGMVMRKCGMRYEGTLRSAGLNNQGICDERYYAMLKSDRRPENHEGDHAFYVGLFNGMHPGFFQKEYIRRLPEEAVFAELVMDLHQDEPIAETGFSAEGITFGEYRGGIEALRDAVRRVDEDWVKYFYEGSRYFCAFDGNRIAAFCILEDMGRYGSLHISGPGCVGTIPEYRRRGIGLEMVRLATEVLRKEGFDLSWIHYTHLEHWYSRLGYRTVLHWNRNGIL